MKITDVQAFPISFPLETPAQDATGVWHSWDTVIVKITAEDGTFGYGEIGPIHGGGIPIFKAMVDCKLRDLIIGEDAFDRERLYEKMVGRGTSSYALGQKGAIITAVSTSLCGIWLARFSMRLFINCWADVATRGSRPTQVDSLARAEDL